MNHPLRSLACTLLAVSALPACGGGSGGGSTTGTISGTLAVLQVEETTVEAEPNDNASTSHRLGSLRIGDSRRVFGSITDDGSDDFDGFQVNLTERASVDVTLTGVNGAADLDVYLVDPISLQFIDGLTSLAASESGTFTLKGPAYLVVDAASGTSDYDLLVEVNAPATPLAEVEPNDANSGAQYLGELTAGDGLTVDGSLGGGDVTDRFWVAYPEAGNLNLDLTFDLGQDFDIRVFDVTSDIATPALLQSFTSTSTSMETGSVAIPAMTLVQVEVYIATGSGNWSLDLTHPSTFWAAGEIAELSARPRASAALESARIKNAPEHSRFTDDPAPSVVGEMVVRLEPGPSGAAAHDRRGVRLQHAGAQGLQQMRFDLPAGLSPEEQRRYSTAVTLAMNGGPGVAYAEPNYLYQPSFDTRPNDQFYNLQWHYEAINLPAAWDIETGSGSVIVAVLDTGSTPAPDLDGREISGFDMIASPTIAGDGNGYDSDPFDVGDSNGPQPSSYHGSHVAGTIGAETNNSQGVAGVTWAGGIMHVRVLGIGGGTNFDIANGILYAARLTNASGSLPAARAHVMNLSLGGPGYSQTMQDAVTAARGAGTVIVAAAGNENSSTPSYPAAYSGVISVSAVGYEWTRAPYSNFHPSVDLAAPGGNVGVDLNGDGYADGVLSTKPDDQVNPINYGSYSFYQGTSMAAPHVAGVAALMLSVNPGLSVADVESILASTATDLGQAGRDNLYGEGLVNAHAAVLAASGGGGGAPELAIGDTTVLLSGAASAGTQCRRVSISNNGGGSLNVTSAMPSTQSGGPWLSASLVPALSGTSTDTTAVDICADPTGLADGTYRGDVAIMSNGGNVTVQVVLSVGAATGGSDYTVFIVAVDSETIETLAQVTVQSQGALDYTFANLPAGSYFIVAGTDEDNDGFICDPGEPLCGAYPSLELPTELTVTGGTNLGSRDFPLQEVFGGASHGPQGVRLLSGPEWSKDQRGESAQ